MTGLTTNTTYYVIRISNNTIQLASSLANAQNGTAISLSSDGTGIQTFAITFTSRTVGQTGGEETHAMSSTELLAHTHTVTYPGNGGGGSGGMAPAAASGLVSMTVSSPGGNAAMNIMQPFAVVTYVIKY